MLSQLVYEEIVRDLARKVALAARLGQRMMVTPQTEDTASTRRWDGAPLRRADHRELALSQLRDRLPAVLNAQGDDWDLPDALDAFLTAMSHYAVSESRTWAVPATTPFKPTDLGPDRPLLLLAVELVTALDVATAALPSWSSWSDRVTDLARRVQRFGGQLPTPLLERLNKNPEGGASDGNETTDTVGN